MEKTSTTEAKAYTHPSNPLRLTTVNLLRTFKRINEFYYARKKLNKLFTCDVGVDDSTDYSLRQGEMLNDRFEVVEANPLGCGTFGIVAKCFDHKLGQHVAVKISRNNEFYHAQARVEKWLLEKFMDLGGESHGIVKYIDAFPLQDRQCIVFELLGQHLYEILQQRKLKGLSLATIQKIASSSLRALEFLSRPEIDVIHADIKPENLLVCVGHKEGDVKLIDFGSSCKANENMQTYIQSRFYRAPEVLMGLPYGQPVDMWSLGATLCELFTGRPLFGGRDEIDQMVKIIEVVGLPPAEMVLTALERHERRLSAYSDPGAAPAKCVSLFDHASDSQGFRLRENIKIRSSPIDAVILRASMFQPYSLQIEQHKAVQLFTDFIVKMVQMNPDKRATPSEILRHPFMLLPL